MAASSKGFRILFIKQNGECYFCKGLLGDNRKANLVHHVNGDHTDNRLSNRVAVHASCHRKHHSNVYIHY